jgi:hypothetical protein
MFRKQLFVEQGAKTGRLARLETPASVRRAARHALGRSFVRPCAALRRPHVARPSRDWPARRTAGLPRRRCRPCGQANPQDGWLDRAALTAGRRVVPRAALIALARNDSWANRWRGKLCGATGLGAPGRAVRASPHRRGAAENVREIAARFPPPEALIDGRASRSATRGAAAQFRSRVDLRQSAGIARPHLHGTGKVTLAHLRAYVHYHCRELMQN